MFVFMYSLTLLFMLAGLILRALRASGSKRLIEIAVSILTVSLLAGFAVWIARSADLNLMWRVSPWVCVGLLFIGITLFVVEFRRTLDAARATQPTHS